jgi:hypothetical protein
MRHAVAGRAGGGWSDPRPPGGTACWSLLHNRAQEAARFRQAGRPNECRVAGRIAVALSQGLIATLQYERGQRAPGTTLVARTRFAGDIREGQVEALAASEGNATAAIHQACGGSAADVTDRERYALFGGTPVKESSTRSQESATARRAVRLPSGAILLAAVEAFGTRCATAATGQSRPGLGGAATSSGAFGAGCGSTP